MALMTFHSILLIVILNFVSAENVKVLANTLTSILNRKYTEDVVFVRSKIECAKLCTTTTNCETISYAADSKCLLRKYTHNILYPLIIDTLLSTNPGVMFLRKHDDYCMAPSGYQFEPNLHFWYKLVLTPKLTALEAREVCRQDKAYLLLIDDDNQYFFTRNVLVENNLSTAYIQGVRQTENDPFLDELGRVMTYDQNWNADGLQGPGNFMRIAETSGIETSRGTAKRAFVCQLRLN